MIIIRIMIMTAKITSAIHPPAAIAVPISSTAAATALAAAAIAFATTFAAPTAAFVVSRTNSGPFLNASAATWVVCSVAVPLAGFKMCCFYYHHRTANAFI
jgi:hypothetical protein